MEFGDPDAAASAVRNLNGTELGGRQLRVDWSNEGRDDDPRNQQGQTGGQTSGAGTQSNGSDPFGANIQQQGGASSLPPLPAGADLPPGLTATDAISRTLQTLPPAQLLDIISQMKGLVMSDPSKATDLLKQAPQLSYAIFQALLLLGLVDTSVLTTVLEQPTGQPQPGLPQPPPPLAPQQQYGAPPPQAAAPPVAAPAPTPVAAAPLHQQPQYAGAAGGYAAQAQQAPAVPTPPPVQQPPPQQAMLDKNALIQQVLAMPQSQIDMLGPVERQQIMALRAQYSAHQF